MMSLNNIGGKIRQLRQGHGVTQKQLAEFLKYSESFVSYMESGARPVDPKDLPKLAEFFSVPSSYFFDHHFANFRAEPNHNNEHLDEIMNNFKAYAKDKLDKDNGRS